MKNSGVSYVTKFRLLVFLGHPSGHSFDNGPFLIIKTRRVLERLSPTTAVTSLDYKVTAAKLPISYFPVSTGGGPAEEAEQAEIQD